MSGLQARLSARFENVAGRTRASWTTETPLDLRGPLVQHEGPDLFYLRNHTAGIFAGDDLAVDIEAGCGVDVRIAAPSSTKVFAADRPSHSRLRIGAAEGARLEWGPHPIILHAGADYGQETRIDLNGGLVVFVDVVVLGRLARGESQRFRRYESELIVVDSAGRTLYEERYRLDPETMPFDASLASMGAIASVYVLGEAAASTDFSGVELPEASRAYWGWGVLPNECGVVARGVAASLSEAVAFTEAVIARCGASARRGETAGHLQHVFAGDA